MRAITHQKIFADFHTELSQLFDLPDKSNRIDNYAVADDADFSPAQNSRRNEMQDVSRVAVHNRVPRVVPALAAHDHVGVTGKHVDDLALAFISPLGAN